MIKIQTGCSPTALSPYFSAVGAAPYYFFVTLFKRSVINTITPITMKILSIPTPMYLKFSKKFAGLNCIASYLLSYIKKFRIRPPAITDAI